MQLDQWFSPRYFRTLNILDVMFQAFKGNNILDSQNRSGQSFGIKTVPDFIGRFAPDKRRKKKPVTLIVGIVCRDGIVLASESQSTDPATGLKRCDTIKIHKIELADGKSFLVAGAASTDLCAETVKAMERIAKNCRQNDYQAPADIATQAADEVKKNQRRWFLGTKKELTKHLLESPFSLMIASFYKKKPYISILESRVEGLVWPRSQPVVVLGNSQSIAEYILKDFTFKEMGLFNAILAAIYAINEVMAIDSTCGKPIQVGTVFPSGNPKRRTRSGCTAWLWSPEWIESIRAEFDERAGEMKAETIKQMESVFRAVAKHILPTGELNPEYEAKLFPNALVRAMRRLHK